MQNNWWKIALVLAAILVIAAFVAPRKLNEFYTAKALKAIDAKKIADAKSNAEKALIFSKKNPLTYYVLGRVALGEEEDKNKQFTSSFIAADWSNFPMADWKSIVENLEKSFSLGLEERLKEENQAGYGYALILAGGAYHELGQDEEAVKKYLEQIDKFPQKSFFSRYFTASTYFNYLDRPQDALGILLPAFSVALDEQKERFLGAYTLAAFLHIYFDKYSEAEEYARTAINSPRAAEMPESYAGIGLARSVLVSSLGAQKKFLEAEKEAAVWNAIVAGEANCALANGYMRGGSYSKAVAIAKNVKKDDVHYFFYPTCLYVLGRSYMAMNNTAEAKKYMNEYLRHVKSIDINNSFVIRTQREFTKYLESH